MTVSPEQRLFALLVAAVAVAAIALMIIFGGFARAAEMATCKIYANRGSSIALRQLLGLPFIDAAAGKYLYRKAYTYCVLQDEVPEISFTPEEQPLITGMPSPPTRPEPVQGSVPATDTADAPADPPAAPKAKKVTKVTKVTTQSVGGQPQALCTSHGKRTVYSGTHWRCLK
jgi:hypothetical protein